MDFLKNHVAKKLSDIGSLDKSSVYPLLFLSKRNNLNQAVCVSLDVLKKKFGFQEKWEEHKFKSDDLISDYVLSSHVLYFIINPQGFLSVLTEHLMDLPKTIHQQRKVVLRLNMENDQEPHHNQIYQRNAFNRIRQLLAYFFLKRLYLKTNQQVECVAIVNNEWSNFCQKLLKMGFIRGESLKELRLIDSNEIFKGNEEEIKHLLGQLKLDERIKIEEPSGSTGKVFIDMRDMSMGLFTFLNENGIPSTTVKKMIKNKFVLDNEGNNKKDVIIDVQDSNLMNFRQSKWIQDNHLPICSTWDSLCIAPVENIETLEAIEGHLNVLSQEVQDIFDEKSLGLGEEATLSYSKKIALSSISIRLLAVKHNKSLQIQWDSLIEGSLDIGKYIQYTCSRVSGIERNSSHLNPPSNFSSLCSQNSPELFPLAWELAKYPQILEKCLQSREPSTLVAYLNEMARKLSSCSYSLRVKGVPEEIALDRLLFFKLAKNVLEDGMTILGLETVDFM